MNEKKCFSVKFTTQAMKYSRTCVRKQDSSRKIFFTRIQNEEQHRLLHALLGHIERDIKIEPHFNCDYGKKFCGKIFLY